MKTKLIWQSIVVGCLIWMIPFALSLPFFSRDGQLLTSFVVFKLVMFLVLALTSWFALGWLFRQHIMTDGARVGLGGLIALVNVLLDVLILLPLTQTPWVTYLLSTASFYLLIPMLSRFGGHMYGKT